MAAIFHVMKEEYERLLEVERLYTQKIESLPKGKTRIKQIHGAMYMYLNRREGNKVVDVYVGRADSKKAQELEKQVEKRNRLVQLRKSAREQLREVKKVLRGKI